MSLVFREGVLGALRIEAIQYFLCVTVKIGYDACSMIKLLLKICNHIQLC